MDLPSESSGLLVMEVGEERLRLTRVLDLAT